MDEDGYLFFKSRSKDLIIRGGANLYPAEIEGFLATHPSIGDVQVFGVPDERMGEEVCDKIIILFFNLHSSVFYF
jgi:fatty-acyl-CoA synthase